MLGSFRVPPHSAPVFYIDEALDGVLEQLFEERDVQFETPRSIGIAEGTEDVVWLSEVGRRRLVVVTKDKRIKRNGREREALIAAEVAAFMLSGGDLRLEEIRAAFGRALDAMLRICRKEARPFIALISRSGDVRLDHRTGRAAGIRRDCA